MSKLKRNSTIRKPIAYLCILLIAVSIFLIVYLNVTVIDVKYMGYDFKVKESGYIGVNADRDALHFGIIPPGSSGARDLALTSQEPARVLIKTIGHDFIHPNINNFILEPGINQTVTFSAIIPPDFPKGNYSGRVRMVFKRP